MFSVQTLPSLVQQYIQEKKYYLNGQEQFFSALTNLHDVIQHAGMARDGEHKKYAHQHRIAATILRVATDTLFQHQSAIAQCRDFEELHQLLLTCLLPINGIANLYIFDCALRIGAFLGFSPKAVYLQAGAFSAAKALVPTLDKRQAYADKTLFPKPLQILRACEIEDFLCTYSSVLSV